MPDNLSQPIPPVPSAPTPMLPASPPPITPLLPTPPPVTPQTAPPTTGGSKKIKIGLAILILFLISVSIPAAVWLTSQRQEVRKEAQGQVCCRVEARNLCSSGFGSWDMTVDSFATEAECDSYIANSSFSYSCNCCSGCQAAGGGSPDPAQICNDPKCPETKAKIRCSSSGSDLRKVIVNQAACAVPTATPPPVTPTPTPVGCYKQCTRGTTVCGSGLVCEDSNEGAGILPFYLCLNHDCPGSPTCACGGPTATPQPTPTPTTTPIPSGTPQPTATPTPGISCLSCKAYDTNWNQIAPSSIQLNQTVYFATQGSTNHPQGITKAKFRINGGPSWQETTNKHGEFFYIQYTVSTARSYTIESMVYNPSLGWY